uniref:Neur_chan_LBD domain-containing protein n=1 Tax=Meloidogyne hapla TaxID=6305 RepID=A0A1I8BCI4_MELHA
MFLIILFVFIKLCCKLSLAFASDDEERLMIDVFRGYNSLILPMSNDSQPIIVRMTLQLILLINVDEKDQIMHTNVWLTLKWKDYQMTWSPVNYGGIKDIRVPPDKIWLPDIVLFNKYKNVYSTNLKLYLNYSADGNYEVSFMSNVVIDHRGDVLWVPPAIYKSSCIIDVEYFPFDEQVCHLIFGSWTYNENEIKMEFEQAELIDLSEYAKSVSSIWDVIDAPASLVNRRSRIEFQLRIRRKTLFYTVVLIIPTVLMAFLSMAVFLLPTDSGEKMTLTISVLLSIVVFLLLVSKIMPPTSSTIPLVAKYLLLTFTLNITTITVTVVIINVYHRGPTTHKMPNWVRHLMPRLLCMKRPKSAINRLTKRISSKSITTIPGIGKFDVPISPKIHHQHCPEGRIKGAIHEPEESGEKADPIIKNGFPLSLEAAKAMEAVEYITEHLRHEEDHKIHRDDWRFVAMVIDRFLLYIFFGVTLGGTIGVLFSAPTVFESVNQQAILQRLIHAYESGRQI